MLPESSVYFNVKKATPSQLLSVSNLHSNIKQADYIHSKTISSLVERCKPTISQLEDYDHLISDISAQSLLSDPNKFTNEFEKSIFNSLISECKLPAMVNQLFEIQDDPKTHLRNYAHPSVYPHSFIN